MHVIFDGIVNVPVKPAQLAKALLPITSRLGGRFNDPVNDELKKADNFIVVTVSGMLSVPENLVPWKARWPIESNLDGSVNVPSQPRLENVWSSMIVICDGMTKSPRNPEHPVKALPPIVVTVFGIVNLPLKPAQ